MIRGARCARDAHCAQRLFVVEQDGLLPEVSSDCPQQLCGSHENC